MCFQTSVKLVPLGNSNTSSVSSVPTFSSSSTCILVPASYLADMDLKVKYILDLVLIYTVTSRYVLIYTLTSR
jgi:hypothetical protein